MTTAIVVVAVLLLLFAALRLWITANRLDRLHVRTEAAWSALEGALARRIVATRAVAAAGGLKPAQAEELRKLADAADHADRGHRADAENDLSRALSTLPPPTAPDLAAELADAGERVVLARRFYNDAVRDTRALRAVLFTRVFGLAGRAALPEFFEIAEYGRQSGPYRRTAGRVVLLDERDRVLLLSGADPSVGSRWWITPGGGLEDGEEPAQAAARELGEETGLVLSCDALVGPIWRRVAEFRFVGLDYEQTELYFIARAPRSAPSRSAGGGGAAVDDLDGIGHETSGDGMAGPDAHVTATMLADPLVDAPLDTSGHTPEERMTLTGHRWWTVEELLATHEAIYPHELVSRMPEVLAALRAGVAPTAISEVN